MSCFSCLQFSTAGNNATDRRVLLEIKAKINDPLGALNSWNDSLPFCNWHGVTCGLMHHRVTVLNLQSSKLSGSISPYIGNLTFLNKLQIQNNSFTGTIPSQIGHLHRLQYLLINNNSFTGKIPLNISGCHGLIQLNAGFNKLVGKIPAVLGSLLNLQIVSLPQNYLTGDVPSSLGNLSSLSRLTIAYTNVAGSLPESLGRLKKLSSLELAQNKLSGLVPASIFNLSSLAQNAGDFGLAKFLATSQTFESTSLGVRGTVGYTPPEYGLGNEVSTRGDVYSFGILLMEMVTGKRPTLEMFKDGLTLHKLVEESLSKEVTEVLDGALFEDRVDVNTENRRGMTLEEASRLVLGLALSCSAELPLDRLNTKEVASEISYIRSRFIKGRC